MGSEAAPRNRQCRDCAFHKDSPENEPHSGGIEGEGAPLTWLLARRDTPFFCHEGTVTKTRRKNRRSWRYTIALPDGYQPQVCAGWIAAKNRLAAAPRTTERNENDD
jgi:hypothetical protein